MQTDNQERRGSSDISDNFRKNNRYCPRETITKLKEVFANEKDFGPFLYQIDILTIAGASKLLGKKQDGMRNKFIEIKRFIREKLNDKNFTQEVLFAIYDYIMRENLCFKIMVNDGIEKVENDRLILKALAKCFVGKFFMNEENKDKKGLQDLIVKEFLNIFSQSDNRASDAIREVVDIYDIRDFNKDNYIRLASKYKEDIEKIYMIILKEVQRRQSLTKKASNKESILKKVESEKMGQTKTGDEEQKIRTDKVEELKRKVENYELMIMTLQAEVETLKDRIAEYQKERETLLAERSQQKEKILLNLFNELNSPAFGNVIDKIYLFANGFEPVDVESAKGIFTNILAVLNLNNFQAHFSENEYKKEIEIRKEEIGTMYRTDRPVSGSEKVYKGEILYPKWTLNNKTIAQKFVRLK